jgi:hypothetical protein
MEADDQKLLYFGVGVTQYYCGRCNINVMGATCATSWAGPMRST